MRWLLRLLGGVPVEDWRRVRDERDRNAEARAYAYIRVLDAEGAWVQSSHVINDPMPDGRDCYPVRVRRIQ